MKETKKIMKKLIRICAISVITLSFFLIADNAYAKTIVKKITSVSVPSTSSSTVTLKWKKINATGYQVYYLHPSSKKYVLFSTTKTPSTTLKNLGSSYKYSLKVRGYIYNKSTKKYTYGAFSNVISAITQPKKPTSISISNITDNTATLKWNNQTRITGYYIYKAKSTTSGKTWYANSNKNSITINKLTPETTYYFYIRPYVQYNKKNYYGSYSSIIKFTTKSVKPSKVSKITTSNLTNTSVKLTWPTAKNAINYKIFLVDNAKNTDNLITSTKSTSYSISNLKDSTTYSYKIVSTNIYNGKVYTSEPTTIKFTTKNTKSKIDSISVNDLTCESATLLWKAISDVSKYKIYSHNAIDNKDTYITTVSTTSYNATNLSEETEYSYTIVSVKTYNKVDYDGEPTSVTFTTKSTKSQVDKINTSNITCNSAKLSWSAIADVSKYRIYSYDVANKKNTYIATSQTTSYTIKKLSQGTEYSYKVVSVKTYNDIDYLGTPTLVQFKTKSNYGIDISSHQGKISDDNWKKIADSGISFVILRATQVSAYSGATSLLSYKSGKNLYKDQYLDNNISEAQKYNISVGLYIYSYADTIDEVKKEADAVITLAKKYKNIKYPISFDFERSERKKASLKEENTKMIETFCDVIKKAGYKTNLYIGADFLVNYTKYDRVSKYGLWVARYFDNNTYSFPKDISKLPPELSKPVNDGKYSSIKIADVVMWQFTSSGKINGISGNVDMDYVYANY